MNNLLIYSFFMMVIFIIFFYLSMYMYMSGMGVVMEWLLLSYNSINIELYILVDWIMCLFISVVMLISSMIMIYSLMYMKGENFIGRFSSLMILFIFSMILMIISPNLVSILFGWDSLGMTSFCLVMYYQNYSSYNSGMVTVLMNRVGDVGLLMSIGLMFMYGSWSIYFMNNLNKLVLLMILLAGITKSAQIPFSAWLPMAMAAPTPVSALVHSSTLVTAGVYLLIRFNEYIISGFVGKILLYISILTMFMSGLMANFENDLKKIIALSTLSQLGLMMVTLSLGLKMLSFFHLLIHAIFKSLLFMCAGILIHSMNNNQDIRLSGKLSEFMPFTFMSFYTASLALMGFPFLAGFYSKDLIMEMFYSLGLNLFLMIMVLISVLLTVSYSIRLMYYIYFGEMKNKSFYYYQENSIMNFSMIILLSLSLFGGSMLFWMFFFDKYFIFMSIDVKMVTIIIMWMGLILGFMMYIKSLMKLYLISYFFSSMWFMNYMYMWIYKPILIMGKESFLADKSWMEFMGKNLFLKVFSSMKVYGSIYKIFMFMFLLYMMLVLIFLII